ncbi:hypothetical protein ACGFYP_34235 [Streptomyces sp. NPDC048370]|uniref:hypothetical protein n=1 Tax=Streptomyces sp. NPDC048370 TaxID=3365540 RepID=UPI00370F7EC1
MINQHDDVSREPLLAGGLSPTDAVLLHRETLHMLRSGIDTAHLDAYSDDPWPPTVLRSYEHTLPLAQKAVAAGTRPRHADPGMGIDIDVRDDAQFELLPDLAPHTIHAEGRRGNQLVFNASDSGTSLRMALTQEQKTELLSRLHTQGIPPQAITSPALRPTPPDTTS